jgi:hypothetical protein
MVVQLVPSRKAAAKSRLFNRFFDPINTMPYLSMIRILILGL